MSCRNLSAATRPSLALPNIILTDDVKLLGGLHFFKHKSLIQMSRISTPAAFIEVFCSDHRISGKSIIRTPLDKILYY